MITKIQTEFIRLDALLKLAGVADTGGQAKWMIQDGTVLLNGEVCIQRGKKIRSGNTVTVGDQTITVE
ncbi:MAG: RNA-binding S4 domain-containing protein [Clostridia bacterium]|nr:RNA-binding S4 domain-containing protein [Clostridia bacterium]